MTILDKLLLGANTAVIGMGIVFIVLIVLWAVIVVQSKLISFFTERFKKPEIADLPFNIDQGDLEGKGITDGEAVISGEVDDEIRAIIMAVVSNYADIPLSRLRFKSTKAL
jgi:oxaloacetate decarboxylase gamma subunit